MEELSKYQLKRLKLYYTATKGSKDDYIKHALYKVGTPRANGENIKLLKRAGTRKQSRKYYYTLIEYLSKITNEEYLKLVSKNG